MNAMNAMKATGIVRRIDELGRVVIPKEIRRTMKINQGDTLEIYTSHGGEIILKKYSPVEDIAGIAAQFAEAMYKTFGLAIIIMDKDTVVACAGVPKAAVIERKISQAIEKLLNSKQLYIWRPHENKIPVIDDGQDKYFAKTVMPILSYGDMIGAVAVIGSDNLLLESTETEIKLTQTAAIFLGKQTGI